MADITAQYLGKDKVPIISQNTDSIIRHRCKFASNGSVPYVTLPKMMSNNGRYIIFGIISNGTDVKIVIGDNADGSAPDATIFTHVRTAGPIDLSNLFNSAPFNVGDTGTYDFSKKYVVITSTGAGTAGNIIVAYTEYRG